MNPEPTLEDLARVAHARDPFGDAGEQADRLWEQTPFNERPLFPFSFMTSPSLLSPAGTARGQHSAPADDISSMAGAHVLTTSQD